MRVSHGGPEPPIRAWPFLFVVALLTCARTLQAPLPYALGHWLQAYEAGFLPRGLPGYLITPLLRLKTPEELRFTLTIVTVTLLLVMLATFARFLAPLLAVRGPLRWSTVALALAVCTSAWTVMNGLIVGYYDHIVDLCVLASAALIGTRRHAWAAVPVCVGILTHELTLWMVPTLAVLTWVTSPRPARDLVTLLAPVVVTAAAVVWSAHTITQPQIQTVMLGIQRWGLIEPGAAQQAVSHLQAHQAAHYLVPAAGAIPSILRIDIALVTFPLVGLLLVAAGAWVGRRAWAFPFAVAAPLSLYLVATDTARIAYTTVFLSVVILAKVARGAAPERPWLARVLLVGGLAATALNVVTDVPLMARVEDREGPLWARSAPARSSFATCSPAFPNAGFEEADLSVWTTKGSFTNERSMRKGGRVPGAVDARWATSGAPSGRGELISPMFLLDRTMLLSVGGGDADAVVELEVDGDVVRDARGNASGALTLLAWDTSPWAGQQGRVVVTDDSIRATLAVDGFCWFGGPSAPASPAPPGSPPPR